MNGTFALTGLFAAALALMPQQKEEAAKGIKIGDEAPARAVAMKGVDGKPTTFDAVAGKKGTLVIFSCVHCPFVKAWDERLAAIGNACKAQEIGVLVINPNDPAVFPDDSIEKMQAQAKTMKYAFPYVVDDTSDVARAYGAKTTPDVFLFDAKHKLVYRGAIDDNSQNAKEVKANYLKDAIAALVAGKPITTAETKSMGCGVKLREKKGAKGP